MSAHEEADVARLYHLHSSNVRSRLGPPAADPLRRPFRFRTYPGSPRVALPGRDLDLPGGLGDALAARASVRRFLRAPLDLERVGRLLYAGYGVLDLRQVEGLAVHHRASPSAGGLYPLELYAVCQDVQGLADGIYHYDPLSHELERRRAGGFHHALADLTIGQDMIEDASLALVIAGVFFRTMWKYGQRGYRYVWLDAGHLAQNLYLAAGALGLGAVAVGGFFDQELDELLALPADEEALYLVCAGHVHPDGADGAAGH